MHPGRRKRHLLRCTRTPSDRRFSLFQGGGEIRPAHSRSGADLTKKSRTTCASRRYARDMRNGPRSSPTPESFCTGGRIRNKRAPRLLRSFSLRGERAPLTPRVEAPPPVVRVPTILLAFGCPGPSVRPPCIRLRWRERVRSLAPGRVVVLRRPGMLSNFYRVKVPFAETATVRLDRVYTLARMRSFPPRLPSRAQQQLRASGRASWEKHKVSVPRANTSREPGDCSKEITLHHWE